MFDGDERFLRRIPHFYYDFVNKRIESWAFDNGQYTPNRMSVNWEKLSSVEKTIEGNIGYGVAAITAEACYRENQDIEPTPTNGNEAHCDVVGSKPKTVMRRLRNAAVLLLAPVRPNRKIANS